MGLICNCGIFKQNRLCSVVDYLQWGLYLKDMNKIMIVPNTEEFFTSKKSKRGAKVYGIPLSKELASYIDDAAPQAGQRRLIDMFFAGKFSPISMDSDDDDEDIDFGEDL